MSFKLPDRTELQELASDTTHPLSETEADAMLGYMQAFEMGFQFLDQAPAPLPEVKYGPRDFSYPEPNDNPLNAWYVQTKIEGASSGPLAGIIFAVKDNMQVAGLPMLNGTSYLDGMRPEFDATVVTRMLDAGATLVGKSTCEFLCLHGGSTTSSKGFVRNPHNREHSAGGSSSGSAALVGSEEVDIALGTDQAGSVRIPSSWSGTIGMKPTFGLVPVTGVAGLEATLDHIGPITNNVSMNAQVLEVLAGADGLDGRQGQPKIRRYTESLGKSIAGMKIGVLSEGFDHPESETAVDETVRAAAETFSELGAEIENVSIPLHFPAGVAIWSGLAIEPVWHGIKTGGVQFNLDTIYSPAFVDSMHNFPQLASNIPLNVRMIMLFGRYLERFGGQYYARARNLLPQLRSAYDQALNQYDLLLLPTTATQASTLPDTGDDMDAHIIKDLLSTSGNTCQFDATGHPAISIPCGTPNGLPVGLMLVGKHFDEATIYRAAHAFELANSG